jgi:hypothetical protein
VITTLPRVSKILRTSYLEIWACLLPALIISLSIVVLRSIVHTTSVAHGLDAGASRTRRGPTHAPAPGAVRVSLGRDEGRGTSTVVLGRRRDVPSNFSACKSLAVDRRSNVENHPHPWTTVCIKSGPGLRKPRRRWVTVLRARVHILHPSYGTSRELRPVSPPLILQWRQTPLRDLPLGNSLRSGRPLGPSSSARWSAPCGYYIMFICYDQLKHDGVP